MKIDLLTLFPNSFAPLKESILGRAQQNNKIEINIKNIRDFSKDRHLKCDDTPFGGGEGMVMTPQPLFDSIKSVQKKNSHIIYFSPKGRVLNQKIVEELSKEKHLVLICGHYEGIDQRVIDYFSCDEISIGDYVLTGGELPAMVLIDSVARLQEGVLGNENSYKNESFSSSLLEFPQYTKPAEFEGMRVPEVLLGGNHKEISKWREKESIKLTKERRPELLYKEKIKFVVSDCENCVGIAKRFLSNPDRKTLYQNAKKDFDIDETKLKKDFDGYVEKQVKKKYKATERAMQEQCELYQTVFNNVSAQIFDCLESVFGVVETEEVYAYMWPSVICPYNDKGFYVSFSSNAPMVDNTIKTAVHELIHRFWWMKWDKLFKKKKRMLEHSFPATSWFLSEMVVHTITKNSDLIKFVGKRKIAYDDFYEMKFDGKNLYDVLDELYNNNSLEDFMQLAYEFVEKNKKEMLKQYNR